VHRNVSATGANGEVMGGPGYEKRKNPQEGWTTLLGKRVVPRKYNKKALPLDKMPQN